MLFIHSAVFVMLVRTLVTTRAERQGVTELTLGCHAHPPKAGPHTSPKPVLSEIPAHVFVALGFRSATLPGILLHDAQSSFYRQPAPE